MEWTGNITKTGGEGQEIQTRLLHHSHSFYGAGRNESWMWEQNYIQISNARPFVQEFNAFQLRCGRIGKYHRQASSAALLLCGVQNQHQSILWPTYTIHKTKKSPDIRKYIFAYFKTMEWHENSGYMYWRLNLIIFTETMRMQRISFARIQQIGRKNPNKLMD